MNPNSTWTCTLCGASVPYGATHSCLGQTTPVPQPIYTYLPYMPVMERIAVALEKIAQQLEKK